MIKFMLWVVLSVFLGFILYVVLFNDAIEREKNERQSKRDI